MLHPFFFVSYLIVIAARKVSADHLAANEYTVNIVQSGDYNRDTTKSTTLSFAEPYKLTKLALETTSTATNDDTDNHSITGNPNQHWTVKIRFLPRDDEIWPDDQVHTVLEEMTGYTLQNVKLKVGSSAEITFKLPGTYVMEYYKQEGSSSQLKLELSKRIRVAYARRSVLDLSKKDWDNYVEAIWTLKNLSTAEGQAAFNCPHFRNIDVFTTMHGVHSTNSTCDQIHYGTMMGFAHQAWMTLLEKALQCVHPSISMPYYNVMKDFAMYYKPKRGLVSMLDSPIYGPDYYGGGHANWNNRVNPHDPYYVKDGRFAYFPLRQNRTGLCDESLGIFDDDTYIPACKYIMEEEGGYLGWQDPDPEISGLWSREPRDLSSYKYVSARRWYVYGSMADNSLKSLIPTFQELNKIIKMTNAFDQLEQVDSLSIHGYAHIALSGLWGGGGPWSDLSLLDDRNHLLQFTWADETKVRDQGCYKCSRIGCDFDNAYVYEHNCYNINNNFKKPTIVEGTIKQPYWTKYALKKNRWYEHLIRHGFGSWNKVVNTGLGTFHANTGTFGRHPWANQDPIFYVHHASIFLVRDYALSHLVKNGHASPPLYGLDEYLANRGVPECPGHNPTDTSVFKNLVRYKVGQEPGSHHEWRHVMEMWSPGRRDYEWVV